MENQDSEITSTSSNEEFVINQTDATDEEDQSDNEIEPKAKRGRSKVYSFIQKFSCVLEAKNHLKNDEFPFTLIRKAESISGNKHSSRQALIQRNKININNLLL